MSDLLPPNASKQERAVSLATARIGDIEVPTGDIYDPMVCPLDLLPWLAWAMNVESWDSGWSESQKRNTIKEQFKIHKLKGTVGSVKRTANAFGVNVVIQEWFQKTPIGTPYNFTAEISIPTAPVEQQQNIQRALLGAIPVRCRLDLQIVQNGSLPLEVLPLTRFAIFNRFQFTLN